MLNQMLTERLRNAQDNKRRAMFDYETAYDEEKEINLLIGELEALTFSASRPRQTLGDVKMERTQQAEVLSREPR